jgi:cellulose synthase/poly-beta-1,6-N-acetylglucosamine synthase-like glycosyltransferase
LLALYIIPSIVFILSTSLAAIFSRHAAMKPELATPPQKAWERRFLVVIPAHDEAANIKATVLSCKAIRYPASLFDVLVIADNCTDNTGSRARDARARVIDRNDPTKKSKGHALEDLINTLFRTNEMDSLDALVVIDADSTVQPGLLEQFSLALDRGCDWIQCYDGVANPDQSWRTRLMAYGFSLINGVTLAGQNALGLSAGLRGNGMCISTRGLRRVPWKAHGLAEDLEYSWTVRIAGGRIEFVSNAAVFATMLSAGGGPSANQRRRWEFGRSALRLKMFWPLLRSPYIRTLEKAAAVIELIAQPTINIGCAYLALWALLLVGMPGMLKDRFYVTLFFVCVTQTVATLALLVHALSPFLLSLLPWRFALSIGYIPYYMLWKLSVMAQGRPTSWIRTSRETRQSRRARVDVLATQDYRPEKGETPDFR